MTKVDSSVNTKMIIRKIGPNSAIHSVGQNVNNNNPNDDTGVVSSYVEACFRVRVRVEYAYVETWGGVASSGEGGRCARVRISLCVHVFKSLESECEYMQR